MFYKTERDEYMGGYVTKKAKTIAGVANLEDKIITQNGIYTASEGFDAIERVSVNVQSSFHLYCWTYASTYIYIKTENPYDGTEFAYVGQSNGTLDEVQVTVYEGAITYQGNEYERYSDGDLIL